MWVDVNHPVHGTSKTPLESNECTPHERLPTSMGHHLRTSFRRKEDWEKPCFVFGEDL